MATLALVAALASVTVALTSYLLVRTVVLDRATERAVGETRRNLQDAAETLPESPAELDIGGFTTRLQLRGGYEIVALDGQGDLVLATGSLSVTDIPAALEEPVARGRVASRRETVDGEQVVVVGGRVAPDGPAWFFFFPLSRELADLAVLRNVLIGVSASALALSALVGVAAARGLLRPIGRMRDAVHRLEGGALGIRLPETGRDELAELARSFNRMAQALQATVGDLTTMEATQRRFVADVSHELRTPLTALTTAADVLEDNAAGLNHPGQRAARLLTSEARRLGALVEDLMEISRLDAGVAPMSTVELDMARAVAATLETRGWTGRVQTLIPPGIGFEADPRRLDAMLANLVSNALEHGGPPVRITARERGAHVVVEVADGGPGIGAEHLPHLFDRFYKAETSRPRSAGSGLGLAIARENARLHGGDLVARSGGGAGAVFALTLPRRAPGTVAGSLPEGDAPVTSSADHGPHEPEGGADETNASHPVARDPGHRGPGDDHGPGRLRDGRRRRRPGGGAPAGRQRRGGEPG